MPTFTIRIILLTFLFFIISLKIGVATLTYNCKEELESTLESTTPFYPVIIIDGKWEDFMGDTINSNDGTLDLVESYSNTVLIQSGNKSETFNRNLSCRYAGRFGCDVVIILDSDEAISFPNGYEAFEKSLKRCIQQYPDSLGFRVTVHSKRHGGVEFSHRILLNPSFVRYQNQHNKIFFMDKEIKHHSSILCPNIDIIENRESRTEERLAKMLYRNKSNPIH
jgi:hypothetical protein